jgi:hypothetical protein
MIRIQDAKITPEKEKELSSFDDGNQCFVSRLDPKSIGSVDPDPGTPKWSPRKED